MLSVLLIEYDPIYLFKTKNDHVNFLLQYSEICTNEK